MKYKIESNNDNNIILELPSVLHMDYFQNIMEYMLHNIDFTLNDIISNNDYLMIKGSNATGLNNFCKRMIKGF